MSFANGRGGCQAGDVHLDTDSVLMEELVFVPFSRATLFGMDLGPKSLWTMLIILGLNFLFIYYSLKN